MADKVYKIVMIVLSVIAVAVVFAVMIIAHLPSRVDCSNFSTEKGVSYAPTPMQCVEGGKK